VSRPGTGREV